MPTPGGEGPHQKGWNNGVTTGLPNVRREPSTGPCESNYVKHEVDDDDHEIQ